VEGEAAREKRRILDEVAARQARDEQRTRRRGLLTRLIGSRRPA
jgi:hypothetical protein